MRSLAILCRRAIWAARAGALRLDSTEFLWEGDAVQTELGEARWIQIATAGAFKGHRNGPFELTADVFQQLIRNFQRHPSFKLGPTGVGFSPVVPFDWRHVSEDPAGGGGPSAIVEQAAQGWACDLQMRVLPMQGTDAAGRAVVTEKATLWSLAVMLEPAKSLIQQKKIRWTSVAIWPNTPDPVTGEDMGWYLSSVALTNDPFIQGMIPIAASRTGSPVMAGVYVDPYDRPTKASEVVERLRRLFGLAEMADLREVLSQIATLRTVALGQMPAPAGVDVEELIGALKALFNLPIMSDAAAVFAEADKLIAALAQEQAIRTAPAAQPAAAVAPPIPESTSTTVAAERAAHKEIPIMIKLLALLATALRVAPTEEAVLAAVQRVRLDRIDLRKLFALASDGKDEEDKPSDAESALAKIKALLSAAGVENVDDATKQLVQKCSDVKNLMETVPELMAAMSAAADDEDKAALDDTEEVMASRGYDQRDTTGRLVLDRDGVDYASILLHRRTNGRQEFRKMPAGAAATPEAIKAWVTETKALLSVRRLARDAFVAEYMAAPEAVPGQHYLEARLVAPASRGQSAPTLFGGPRGGNVHAFGGGRPGAPAMQDPLGRGETQAVDLPDLRAFSGNRTQRLLGAAEQRMGEGWKKLTDVQRFAKKRELEAQYTAAGVDLSAYDVAEGAAA